MSRSEFPVGSIGWYCDIGVIDWKDSMSTGMFNRIEEFEFKQGGVKYLCEAYLSEVSSRLKDLTLLRIEKAHDIHAFLKINSGAYKGKILHLQAYPGFSSKKEITLTACIKEEAVDNTPNIEYFWQKPFPLADESYTTVLSSLEAELELKG